MVRWYLPDPEMSQRLAAISRETLSRILAEKRPLIDAEVQMLLGLDPVEVSRFAGKYFLTVDDSPLEQVQDRLGGRPGRFGTMCVCLAIDGTKDAVPGLLEAMAQKRILAPTPSAPFDLPWVALLSIAERDPWPETDPFLANLLHDRRSLKVLGGRLPELGATAAAVLLRRHGGKPGDFGLEEVPEPHLYSMHLVGYRFANEDARKKVQLWWERTKGQAKAAASRK
jgi:hypothetical protein